MLPYSPLYQESIADTAHDTTIRHFAMCARPLHAFAIINALDSFPPVLDELASKCSYGIGEAPGAVLYGRQRTKYRRRNRQYEFLPHQAASLKLDVSQPDHAVAKN